MGIIEYSVDSRQGTTDTGVRCYRGNNFYASSIRQNQLMAKLHNGLDCFPAF